VWEGGECELFVGGGRTSATAMAQIPADCPGFLIYA